MSETVETTMGMCLREARRAAGYQSAGQAAGPVSLSPETVGRHERGTAKLLPEDTIHYAKVYKRPDLMVRYCDGCPIHREIYGGARITDRSLPWTTMRLTTRLRRSALYAEQAEVIMDDGRVDASEAEQWLDLLEYLAEIGTISREILAASMSLGIIHDTKKAAPTDMGAAERAKTTHSKAGQMAHAYCTTVCMSMSK